MKYSIKNWRHRMGYTHKQAAEKLGVSMRTYKYYEANQASAWRKLMVMGCKFIESQEK